MSGHLTDADKEIEDARNEGRPFVLAKVFAIGVADPDRWISKAFEQAQEDKEIALGRRPPKIVPQPNPAISSWQHVWKTANMNNNRELGPGDVKK